MNSIECLKLRFFLVRRFSSSFMSFLAPGILVLIIGLSVFCGCSKKPQTISGVFLDQVRSDRVNYDIKFDFRTDGTVVSHKEWLSSYFVKIEQPAIITDGKGVYVAHEDKVDVILLVKSSLADESYTNQEFFKHIAAIGSYLPARREVPAATVARARVAVDDVEAALAEAGDLLRAIDEGAFAAERILTDLPGLVRGASVRTSVEDVTLFKAVGSAFEDLIVASAVA